MKVRREQLRDDLGALLLQDLFDDAAGDRLVVFRAQRSLLSRPRRLSEIAYS
jgi:hypothetical protein